MNPDDLIWATRGRTWGFRFLRDGGEPDPLPVYESVFRGVGGDSEVCRAVGDRIAVRFPDPEARTDRAGRVIPHEFVVPRAQAEALTTVDAARALIWPLVMDEYARAWDTQA